MPSTSSSSTVDLPTTGRMTAETAAALVEGLHGHLKPTEGRPTHYSVPSCHAPTTLQRRQLSAVAGRLERDLAKLGAPDEREYVIGRFLLGYEKGKGSELNAGLLNEEFLEAVEGQPLSAIEEACARIRSAKPLTDIERGWRPSPDDFAGEVAEGLIEHRKRLLWARRILGAEVYEPPTPEKLAEVEKARADATAILAGRSFPAERRASQDARDELPLPVLETVRPITGDISHLMSNLDRRRAHA